MHNKVIFTAIFDYIWMIGSLYIYNIWINNNLTPFKASTMVFIFIGEFIRELLQMHIFFYNQISNEARSYVPDKALIISIIRLKISFGLAAAISSYYGYFIWNELSVYSAIQMYLEFMIMILIKDIQLDIFHSGMHNGTIFGNKFNKWLSTTHKFHHTTKYKLNSISAFYTTMEDAVMENLAAPFVILGFKLILGYSSNIHIGAFMLYIVYDVHGHSANPYTVVFFNPIMDYYMKANIAHHNHHTNPNINHRVIPWRHIWSKDSIKKDIKIYNENRTKKIKLEDFYRERQP